MPKDEWRNETQRINARRNKLEAERARRKPPQEKDPKLKVIPVGSPILARKNGTGEFRKITTTKQFVFLDISAMTDKAMLVEAGEWEIWVGKSLVKDL